MKDWKEKQSVADAGRRLLAEGLVARTWGNVSCRTGEDGLVITPSGLGYEGMRAEDVVSLRMSDGAWEGSRKPSSEKGVHIAAYQRFSDAGFVIHTHQTYATALGLAGFDELRLSEADSAALGGLALAAYGLPGTKRLRNHVTAAMADGAHVVLMAHHGALIVGRDMEEAFSRTRLLEALCRAACKGQPEAAPGDMEAAERLAQCARAALGCAGYTLAPAVVAASQLGEPPDTQLDDMAQMIGHGLIPVPPEEAALLAALKRRDAVLVQGVGAVCRAGTEGDVAALCLLTEKACVACLHTRACGKAARLPWLDVTLMRQIYLRKYAKKIGG